MTHPPTVEPLAYPPDEVAKLIGPGWEQLLRSALRWMLLGRALDARMQGLQRQGRVGFYGAATGHEAVNVAAGLASTRDDWVFPGLREQLIALVRGHPLATYAHHLFANASDPARGRNMPCHPTASEVHFVSMSSVIGTQVSHAVGVAYGQKLRKEAAATLAFFGDGATSSNDFHAGLNLAGVWQLPVVFCCANNQWAISMPVVHQTASASLASKASAYGFAGLTVDGTDFIASYAALARALNEARAGHGPCLLEFVVYRMVPHSSSDDPGRYQPTDWMARATAHDPVDRLRSWLAQQSLMSDSEAARWTSEADREVRAAVEEAEKTPPPAAESLTEDVYASRSYPYPAPRG